MTYPTRGQLERTLSQKIQAFYRSELGHQPSKVTCELFDEKLAIILEDSITMAEQILVKEGQNKLAKEVNDHLDDAIKPQLKILIKDILGVDVLDLLSDATLETGRKGLIAILKDHPQIRNSNEIKKK